MPLATRCESLERRSLFAVTPAAGLNPKFAFDTADIRKIAGEHTAVYDAVPASGDRTYILAERYNERKLARKKPSEGYLAIARVTADGKLDPTFGTNGVALTERVTETRRSPDGEPPGILKVDVFGRIYVADSYKVLRLRANGTIDRAFGTRGSAAFGSYAQPAALTDIAPTTDDSVYVSTTATTDGVQRFTVQEVGRSVRTVFTKTHDTGIRGLEEQGENQTADGTYNGERYFLKSAAQFAYNLDGVFLARVETDYRSKPDTSRGYEATRQQVVVTGVGGFNENLYFDVATAELRKGRFGSTNLITVQKAGRFVYVQTGVEVVRLNVFTTDYKRFTQFGDSTLDVSYRLLPDGYVYVVRPSLGRVDYRIATIEKIGLDNTPDATFGDKGLLTIRLNKKTDAKNYLALGQLFLSSSNRPYLLIRGYYGGPTSLQRV